MAGEDVRLPGGLSVNRKIMVVGAGVAAGVVGLLWWSRRKAAATAAPSDPQAAADAAAGGDPYGTTPGAGPAVDTSPTGGYQTNWQWAQAVVADAQDPAAMTLALGKYLNGLSVTAGGPEEAMINSARALWGDPPVSAASGYPPAIRTQPSTGQTNPPDALYTPPAPVASKVTRSSVTLTTPPVSGAKLYEWVKNGGDHAHTTGPSYTDPVRPGERIVYAVWVRLADDRKSNTSPQTVVTTPK